MTNPEYNNIYERLDDGDQATGTVYDDIADMTISEMEDYFQDADPVEFL